MNYKKTNTKVKKGKNDEKGKKKKKGNTCVFAENKK
jgi:hypothetical protein